MIRLLHALAPHDALALASERRGRVVIRLLQALAPHDALALARSNEEAVS